MTTFDDMIFGTHGYVGHDTENNAIIVAFRGTENLLNWLENIDFAKTNYTYCQDQGCKVHTGFQIAYESL